MDRVFRVPLLAAALSLIGGAAVAAPFAKADADHDGYVTFRDAKRVLPRLAEVNFEKFDFDNDGLIDKGEWTGLDNFYTVLYRER